MSCAAGSPSPPRPPPACAPAGEARRWTRRRPGRRRREVEPRPRRHAEGRRGCLTSAVSIGHADRARQTASAERAATRRWPGPARDRSRRVAHVGDRESGVGAALRLGQAEPEMRRRNRRVRERPTDQRILRDRHALAVSRGGADGQRRPRGERIRERITQGFAVEELDEVEISGRTVCRDWSSREEGVGGPRRRLPAVVGHLVQGGGRRRVPGRRRARRRRSGIPAVEEGAGDGVLGSASTAGGGSRRAARPAVGRQQDVLGVGVGRDCR